VTDDEVIRLLTCELALFLLMFSESANIRHLPEAMAFIYWVMRFSHTFEKRLPQLPVLTPYATVNDHSYDMR
jgi:hypothetical protein